MWKQKVHVHADPEQTARARELSLCRNTIKRIKETLLLLEQKHNRTTEAFMEDVCTGRLPDDPDMRLDYDAWKNSYESLRQWEDLEKQYVELFPLPDH